MRKLFRLGALSALTLPLALTSCSEETVGGDDKGAAVDGKIGRASCRERVFRAV